MSNTKNIGNIQIQSMCRTHLVKETRDHFLKSMNLKKKYGEIQGINVLEILKNYWEGGLQSTENIY